MSFLKYIDEAYEKSRKTYYVQESNKDYRIYFDLSPIDFKAQIDFLCMKKDRAHILIAKNGIITYLSDADIVYNLSTASIVAPDLLRRLVDSFKLLYQGTFSPFGFSLDGSNYSGQGIPYFTDEYAQLKINIHSDVEISANDLVFVLNMIFEKDRLTDVEFGGDRLKHTLCKYISLSQYYAFESEQAKQYLDSIGYSAKTSVINSPEKPYQNRIFKECDLNVFEKSVLSI